MINKIKKFINYNNLDGYIVPKNDNYFNEYSIIKNFEKITNFSGSAGFCLILKRKNFLFVDGRYTLQAKQQSEPNFTILEIPYNWPKDIKNIENSKIGFDPNLFTEKILDKYFNNKVNLIPIVFNFKKTGKKNVTKIFQLKKFITGESSKTKIKKIRLFMHEKKIDYSYVSSSENVNWLLNIRGKDLPNSPLINCKLIIPKNGKLYLFVDLNKIPKLFKQNFKNIILYKYDKLFYVINKFQKKNFCIDENTCSIFEKNLIKSRFRIIWKSDPIYNFKAIKNKTEIKNTIKAHIQDGVALTRFLYWFKNNRNQISEKIIENKLEKFRRNSKNYLYPSFDTIAGSGPNGAVIHYKSNSQTNRKLKKNEILLIDSGGQYKWGTTDVTRTICSGKISNSIKKNFTRVLKGHIAVALCNLKSKYNGHLIDKLARKSLKTAGLDYAHGTGHGVGFFLNVHEGPQAISKYNKHKLHKGMILSNEPGFYLKNKYGIRIENLIYVDQIKGKLVFKNLTLAPIDIDLVDFKMLTKKERAYLFNYHLDVYSKISRYLSVKEKKWLVSLIK